MRQIRNKYGETFAAVTPTLEAALKNLTPCAKAFARWLLMSTRPGKEIEVELADFAAYSGEVLRSKPYSLRHICRALVDELIASGVIQVVKRYSWYCWKLIIQHPNLPKTSQAEAGFSQAEEKTSETGGSNPHSDVDSFKGGKDSKLPEPDFAEATEAEAEPVQPAPQQRQFVPPVLKRLAKGIGGDNFARAGSAKLNADLQSDWQAQEGSVGWGLDVDPLDYVKALYQRIKQ